MIDPPIKQELAEDKDAGEDVIYMKTVTKPEGQCHCFNMSPMHFSRFSGMYFHNSPMF